MFTPSTSLVSPLPYLLGLLVAATIAGCGALGSQDFVEHGEKSATAELAADPTSAGGSGAAPGAPDGALAAAQSHVTQRALGRNPEEERVDSPSIPLAPIVPASSSANLLKQPERFEPPPQPPRSDSGTLAAGMESTAFLPPQPTPPQPAEPRRVEKVSTDDFEQVVLNSDIPVVVDFYADWCGPCKAVTPLLDELAREQSDMRVVKVNIDHDKSLSKKYRVKSIPTVMFFENGQLVARHTGLPAIRDALAQQP